MYYGSHNRTCLVLLLPWATVLKEPQESHLFESQPRIVTALGFYLNNFYSSLPGIVNATSTNIIKNSNCTTQASRHGTINYHAI